jgi:hypothetical protein
MPAWLLDIGDAAEWVTAVAVIVWIVQYSLLARWWRDSIGITLAGEALAILAIFIPSLMALADPADYVHFATAPWYQWLALCIVVACAAFMVTRIVVWDQIRRQRGHTRPARLPSDMAARIASLQAEVAELRRRLGEDRLTAT